MESTLSDLEEAAAFTIHLMRRIPGLDKVAVTVIGGVAVRYHLPGHRRTDVGYARKSRVDAFCA